MLIDRINVSAYEVALEILNKLPTNSMIQSALMSKTLDNSNSLPEMKKFITEYSKTRGELNFLRAIHVAGSKGKGSVCAFTEQILRSKGFRTGMFTSPHLVHPRERIRINGKPVSEDVFAKHVLRLDADMRSKGHLISFFRFIWIVALDIFSEAKIDVGIIEVGMGGRFDATNVIETPSVCGITSLAMEHVNLLGPTIYDIAWNKAGIIKPNVPILSVKQSVHPETEQVIQREADQNGAPLEIIETSNWIDDFWNLGIDGMHQRDNAALACALADKWIRQYDPSMLLTKIDMKSALAATYWPGRQHRHCVNNNLDLFLDGSHTFESISATAEWFLKVKDHHLKRNLLFFHCSPDRDYIKLLKPLLNILFSAAFFMIPQSAQGDPIKLRQHHEGMAKYWTEQTGIPATVISNIPEDLDRYPTNVLVCGSLYLVGNFMASYKIDS